MKILANILKTVSLIVIFFGILIISRKVFIKDVPVETEIQTDVSELSEGDNVKITFSVKNNGEKAANNVELEIIMPDEVSLRTSSPAAARTVSTIGAGESTSEYVLATVNVQDPSLDEADGSETSEAKTKIKNNAAKWYSAVIEAVNNAFSVCSKYAPVAIIAALLIFILTFVIEKSGRVPSAILLIVAVIAGFGLAPLMQFVSDEFLSKTVTEKYAVTIGGEETQIKARVTFDYKKIKNSVDSYYVVFDSNGADEIAAEQVVSGECAVSPDFPVLGDNVFAGWYSDEALTAPYVFEENPVTEDKVLFAKWVDEEYGWDSDGDGINDSDEAAYGSDAHVFDDTCIDSDGDGLVDYAEENIYYTDPENADTDGDLLSDGDEVTKTFTDPAESDTDKDGTDDYNSDSDKDGLINGDELICGTDPLYSDTDEDGLNDGEEGAYMTNPLVSDTDGDGAKDGWEVSNGFDPLTADASFPVTCSGYDEAYGMKVGATLNISGDPESVTANECSIDNLICEQMPGYMGSAFNFTADGEFDEAVLTFDFDENSLPEDAEPTIYYYDEDTQQLTPLETTVTDGVAYATVSHFSTYILLNKKLMDEVWETRILSADSEEYKNSVFDIAYVIDYSSSMNDNDPDNLRLEIVKQFIEKLRDDRDRATVIKFAAYATTLVSLSTDKTLLINSVDTITNASSDGCDSEAGTNGSDGLHAAIEELKNGASEGDFKYIIFLTDGEDTENSYDYDELINDAIANNIIIYSIGMGDADAELLEKIAVSTGGEYYFASAVDMEDTSGDNLMGAFTDIEISTIDFETDSNEDGISDYYTKLLCEGKLRTGTGVTLFDGISFDEVQANDDYDGDGMKNGEELIVRYDEATGHTYTYIVSSPVSADTDDDGIGDLEDTAPLTKGLAGGVIGKLTFVSCYNHEDSGWTSGHAFFVYTSYVKDTRDFSGLVAGWNKADSSLSWSADNIVKDESATAEYMLSPGESISIGDGALLSGWFDSIDDGGLFERSEENGVSYNMETYKLFDDEYGYSYLSNTYLQQNITENELETITSYCSRSDVCYWSLTHNCAEVASQAWNLIADEKVNPYNLSFWGGTIATPKGLKLYMRTLGDCKEDYDFEGALTAR